MKHKIIQTENYLLVVDDSEIKAGDWIYNKEREPSILQCMGKGSLRGWSKIIAHLPLNNSPILEGVDLLPPLEDEAIGHPLVDYVNSKHTQEECIGFIDGYNKAKEKYKYTEEDLRKAWNAAYIDALAIDEETYKPLFFEDFIQSLQQPKYPIAFECEIEVYMHSINGDIVKPKTTTNSNGQTVWVGKYLF